MFNEIIAHDLQPKAIDLRKYIVATYQLVCWFSSDRTSWLGELTRFSVRKLNLLHVSGFRDIDGDLCFIPPFPPPLVRFTYIRRSHDRSL